MGIDEARAVVRRSGTAGMRVVFEYVPEFWGKGGADLGEYLVDPLGKIGYRGSVKPRSIEAFYGPRKEFQMALGAWSSDYPAASNFINEFFTCDASLAPPSGFSDARIDEMVEEATAMQAIDPVAAGALWAEIDRAIVDQTPYVWLTNPNTIGFVSERVGNYQFSLPSGILLNSSGSGSRDGAADSCRG
jgi:peptide/nickel transport system substrate-binding protein